MHFWHHSWVSCAEWSLNHRESSWKREMGESYCFFFFFSHFSLCCWCYRRNFTFFLLPSAFTKLAMKSEIAVEIFQIFAFYFPPKKKTLQMTIKNFILCYRKIMLTSLKESESERRDLWLIMIDVNDQQTHESIIKCNFVILQFWLWHQRREIVKLLDFEVKFK